MKRLLFCLFESFVIVLIFTDDVFAYIDPGSGSILLQIVIAAVLGSLFYFRNLFKKFILFLKKKLGFNQKFTGQDKK
jgi:hypothetical protein